MTMTKWIATVGLGAVLLGPVSSSAADADRHRRYQDTLLSRNLGPVDKAWCDQKAGRDNQAEYNKCHVTRLFVYDIEKKQTQGFPRGADYKYLRDKTEKDKIIDRMLEEVSKP